MAGGRVSWASLRADPQEKQACRRAGLVAADLVGMDPLELVASTGEEIDEARAGHLIARAGLLERFSLAWVDRLAGLGIASCEELAASSADELFLASQRTSPYTRPDAYRILASKTADAGGPSFVVPPDDELVRRAWVARFGPPLPEGGPTSGRLLIPALDVRAPTWTTGDREGTPPPPIDHRAVAISDPDPDASTVVVVGHWQWAGHVAPFLRLEDLQPGDDVELAHADGATRRFVVTAMRRGRAPLPRPAPMPALLLLSAPHLRWAPWCRSWGDPDLDPEQTLVQVAVDAELVDSD